MRSLASTSMFVRRLVSGVRSSCEASATSCRCTRRRIVQRAEHRVEARREPAELVLAVRVDPLGQVAGLGDVLGRLGQPADRRERGTGDEQPEPGSDADRRPARSGSGPADARERVVDFVSGRATWTAHPRAARMGRDDARRVCSASTRGIGEDTHRAAPRAHLAGAPGRHGQEAALIRICPPARSVARTSCTYPGAPQIGAGRRTRWPVAQRIAAARVAQASRRASSSSCAAHDDVDDDRGDDDRQRDRRGRRRARAARGSSWLAQRVADAAHGLDQPRLAARLGLAPQVADVDVERVRRVPEVVAPDPLEDDERVSTWRGLSMSSSSSANSVRVSSIGSPPRRTSRAPGRARGRRSAATSSPRRSCAAAARARRASSSSSANGLTT